MAGDPTLTNASPLSATEMAHLINLSIPLSFFSEIVPFTKPPSLGLSRKRAYLKNNRHRMVVVSAISAIFTDVL
jgi:hypothetical protein